VYDVQDWAEIRRLSRDGWTNTAIAEKFNMSRNTVAALIAKDEPPRYERAPSGSMLDGFADAIVAMLDDDPKAPAVNTGHGDRRACGRWATPAASPS